MSWCLRGRSQCVRWCAPSGKSRSRFPPARRQVGAVEKGVRITKHTNKGVVLCHILLRSGLIFGAGAGVTGQRNTIELDFFMEAD